VADPAPSRVDGCVRDAGCGVNEIVHGAHHGRPTWSFPERFLSAR